MIDDDALLNAVMEENRARQSQGLRALLGVMTDYKIPKDGPGCLCGFFDACLHGRPVEVKPVPAGGFGMSIRLDPSLAEGEWYISSKGENHGR